ncbi:reverse transcriptase domain-containing protein [Tanacetum coccineum]
MVAIFHDMIEKTMEVFMDDFSVFGDSFSSCLSYLDKMLQRCEDTSLVLNWEKCHFIVKEGIVLGHKISKSGIEDFSKIARPMTHLLEKETSFIFSKECIEAFETLKKKLTQAPILVAPDWDLPFEIMCDASNFAVGAVLGQPKIAPVDFACSKNLMSLSVIKKEQKIFAADHLSRLEKSPSNVSSEKKEIIEKHSSRDTWEGFTFRGDEMPHGLGRFCKLPCGEFCDQRNVVPTEKESFSRRSNTTFGTTPNLIVRYVWIKVRSDGVCHGKEAFDILEAAT